MHIYTLAKTYHFDNHGRIFYTHDDGFYVAPSDSWKVTGAVEYRMVFGNLVPVRRYSLDDILNKRVPWRWKNGKQRCHLVDYDHGAYRTWFNPRHWVC